MEEIGKLKNNWRMEKYVVIFFRWPIEIYW